jgi:hypothetical protein
MYYRELDAEHKKPSSHPAPDLAELFHKKFRKGLNSTGQIIQIFIESHDSKLQIHLFLYYIDIFFQIKVYLLKNLKDAIVIFFKHFYFTFVPKYYWRRKREYPKRRRHYN